MRSVTLAASLGLLGLAVMFVAIQGFVWHSLNRGILGMAGVTDAQGRLAGTGLSNGFIFGHMVFGGVVTLLAVVQSAGIVRRHWPVVHRVSGRILAVCALITGLAGLGYIALRGTIGGPIMDVGFGSYGVLLIVCAIQTPRYGVAGDFERHRRWGLRLIILALGSWIYRVHYGIWYGTTCSIGPEFCGIGANGDFTGLFDLVQMFAFYLPYLLILEWMLRRDASRHTM